MKHANKFLSGLLVLAMLVSCVVAFSVTASADIVVTAPVAVGAVDIWDGTTKTQPTAKDGDVTLIGSAAEFAWFHENAASCTGEYRLTTNIDLGSKTSARKISFSGVFDGAGYTVSNYKYANESWGNYAALFDTLSGTVKNVNFCNFTLSNDQDTAALAMTVAVTGIMENVVLSGTVHARKCSGFANVCKGTIRNCTNYARVETSKTGINWGAAGCIVKCLDGGSVIGCKNYGDLDAHQNSCDNAEIATNGAGGIVGEVKSGSVKNCVNYGAIFGNQKSNGGIVGCASGVCTIENCVNYGAVTGNTAKGSQYGPAEGAVGGILGRALAGSEAVVTVKGCANYGSVTGTGDASVYGIVPETPTACTTSPWVYVGGLVGAVGRSYGKGLYHIALTDCANYGNTNAVNGTAAGGLGGIAIDCREDNTSGNNVTVNNCLILGTATGAFNAGGLVGIAYASSTSGVRYFNLTVNNSVIGDTVIGKNCKVGGHASTITLSGVYAGGALQNADADGATTVTGSVTDISACKADFLAGVANATETTALAVLNTANAAAPYIQNAAAPASIITAALSGASMILNGEVTLNMILNASCLGTLNVTGVTLVADGETYAGTLNDGKYVFEVNGIAAADMADAKDYTLRFTVGENTYDSVVATTYSPAIYAERMYDDQNATENLRNVLVAMMQYADAAETQRDGASSIFEDFTEATTYAGGAYGNYASVSALATAYNCAADVAGINAVANTGARLTNGLNLVFAVTDANVAKLSLTIDGETYTYEKDVDNNITVTDLTAADLYYVFTLNFQKADSTSVAEGTLSLFNFLDGREETALAQATAIYMDAVYTYGK